QRSHPGYPAGSVAARFLRQFCRRAADLVDALGQENNPEWKTVAFNTNGEMVAPNGSIGFRWGEKGKWNLEQRDGKTGEETELQLSLLGSQDEIA
ncbi:hypothetical protein ACUOFC_56155, partial [Escherichia sp. TWPC-MK]